ncbi:hypothetical protein XarjCFBP7652_07665 [Xanthomonas arboricola]|nr:hypothetical protein XarjCFBP7652_07665 [Xanthomonas arboricola]
MVRRWSNAQVIRPVHVMHRLQPCTPTIPTGPCPRTVAGPYAASMPRKVPRRCAQAPENNAKAIETLNRSRVCARSEARFKSSVSRKRDAITTRITFRTPPCSSVTASMQLRGPARERRHRACQRGSKRSRGGRALVNCVSSICCKAMP